MPKKKVTLKDEPITGIEEKIKSEIEEKIKSEKEILEIQRDEFYEMRNWMVQNGVDSIGKLDNLIAETLKRLKELD